MDNFMGESVFVQTVTMYFTGKVTSQDKKSITLSSAAWIPMTGRFQQALETCEFEEVELYAAPVTIMLGAVVAITSIDKLPATQK